MRKNSIPYKARYLWAVDRAILFHASNSFNWFPINPYDIYEHYEWALYSCREIEALRGKNDPLAKSVRVSGVDAKTYRSRADGMYITVYDESQIPDRIRWTLAHEIGHIVLKHLEEFDLTEINRGLNSEQYRVLENEANAFAAELLAPLYILKRLNIENDYDISKYFLLSGEASRNRANALKNNQKKTYIKSALVYEIIYKTYLQKVSICSNSPVLILDIAIKSENGVENMNNKALFVKVNQDGRFINCPKCGNTDFSEDALYCKMCGIYLYNSCDSRHEYVHFESCGKTNVGDARHCEFCGEKTYLLSAGLIMSWEELKEKYDDVSFGSIRDSLIDLTNNKRSIKDPLDYDKSDIPF